MIYFRKKNKKMKIFKKIKCKKINLIFKVIQKILQKLLIFIQTMKMNI